MTWKHSADGSTTTRETTPVCESLAWDTEHWGFPIARVRGIILSPPTLRAIDFWCRANRIRCVYVLANSDDPAGCNLANGNGYQRVDERITLVRNTDSLSLLDETEPEAGFSIRRTLPSDVPALRAIARVSFHDSRFYFDERFPRERCDLLYETWIQRSCEGWADVVLAALHNDVPIGFVSCHFDPAIAARQGEIGLIGVRADHGGRGVGRRLVQAAVSWFHGQGAAGVMVATQQRNLAAQRLYSRCHFSVSNVQAWYHKWYAPGEG